MRAFLSRHWVNLALAALIAYALSMSVYAEFFTSPAPVRATVITSCGTPR